MGNLNDTWAAFKLLQRLVVRISACCMGDGQGTNGAHACGTEVSQGACHNPTGRAHASGDLQHGMISLGMIQVHVRHYNERCCRMARMLNTYSTILW